MSDTTASLTRGLSCCDEGAWRAFHEQYYHRLTAMAVARGGSGCEAPEIVQGVYLRVLRHPKVFQDAAPFEAWLACLTRCEVVDTARRKGRRSLLNERYQQWREFGNEPAARAECDSLEEALLNLNADERSIIRQHYLNGWSQQQLAEHHQTSVKAVESKLARLRKRLRQHLEKLAIHPT